MICGNNFAVTEYRSSVISLTECFVWMSNHYSNALQFLR
ncbi:hypothetical protein GALL_210600 [mine drainage metagenome]|uniref:Uncharacterized protein n=1 Tax=mine drainage metagenome TaxID=410659 RepID=A0A1J5RMP0_9ZZZZ